MIVSSIKTKLISVPFSDPPQTGFLTLEKIDLLIVQVETKDGVIGTGQQINVTPTTSTMYYVRGVGSSCGPTACVSIFINVL